MYVGRISFEYKIRNSKVSFLLVWGLKLHIGFGMLKKELKKGVERCALK